MTTGLRIAVGQFAPSADAAGNVRAVRGLIDRAAAEGARLIVLPEYASYFDDPFDDALAAHAQSLDGPFVACVQAAAATNGVTVVAGVVESTGTRRVHNTVVAVDGDGVQAAYRKLHLYDAFGQRESDWVSPGEIADPETFVVEGVRVGLMTCYDLRFPEVARRVADAAADVIAVPAQWVRGPLKEHHWRTLVTARAIENTLYVVAADHPPPLGVGLSMIVDPLGVALAQIGTATDVATARVDAAEVARVRRVNPALALRRFQVTPRG